MPKHLVLIMLLGVLCHVVLLGFEVPVIVSAVQSVLARQPIATTGAAGVLIAHAIINTGLGAVYALLTKPQMYEALIYGGIAAGLPNAVCTFTGAMIVIADLGSEMNARLGVNLLEPGPAFGVMVFSLFTGLLAAPLGMAGAFVATKAVSAR